MSNRRDRLGGMVGPGAGGPAAPPPSPYAKTVARQRALLFAPPPAPTGPYLQLLEAEGYDVLLAPDPASAEALLRSAPPALIVAVAPVLGSELLERWHAAAPEAELRLVPGFSAFLEERLVPPAELLEFTLRAVSLLAGLVAATQGVTPERHARSLALASAAAETLGLKHKDRVTLRLQVALREVPEALQGLDQPAIELLDATAGERRQTDWSGLAQLAEGLGCPFPVGQAPPTGPREGRPPTAGEVVEVAARYAALETGGDSDPSLALRRLALGEASDLHPAAVEAVIGAAQAGRATSRGSVLIVDPDAAARNLLALRLRNEGYSVRTASDGRAALEEARRAHPQLVLSETVLPGLDGYALLDTLKREGRQASFLFLSSRTDAASVNKGLLLGAADYLAKPVNVEVLLTKLQKVMGQPFDPAGASARISLSDVTATPTATPFETVSYDELAPGVLIMGRFRIETDLGEGGMGKVFRVRDERLEEVVVLKVMKTALQDQKLLEHFKREIRLARKITHPGVVRIYDFWEAGSLAFVTMEYLEGNDLRSELDRRGTFPVPVALRVGVELFEALQAAHGVGVVHRDIKPHNVVLLPNGRIKVLDFGIAQGLEPGTPDAGTITASVIGTPEYMSPEQVLGERLDPRTDIYSAGLLLYELVAGDVPFRGESRVASATLRLHADPAPPSTRNPQVPPAVDVLILRLLQRRREDRPATAREVAAALEALKRH